MGAGLVFDWVKCRVVGGGSVAASWVDVGGSARNAQIVLLLCSIRPLLVRLFVDVYNWLCLWALVWP